jgi:hypothetical protein
MPELTDEDLAKGLDRHPAFSDAPSKCGCCGHPMSGCFCVIDLPRCFPGQPLAPDLVCRTHNKQWFAQLHDGVSGWVSA